MELSEDLLCLFSAQIVERSDSYVIEVPKRELSVGDVDAGGVYRVGLLSRGIESAASVEPEPARDNEQETSGPPVEPGDVVDVEVEDIGEQGDGIARVGPGYVIIVPETERGERVSVEITQVRDNLAFADVVEHYDRTY